MKILVLVQDYLNQNGYIQLMYVHVRNLYYKSKNIDVTVLNFSARESYTIDGINVISYDDYIKSRNEYDILICHAPNIKNHYKFLKSYSNRFNKILFFFHGHEIVSLKNTYPEPYDFKSGKIYNIKSIIREIYDIYKLRIWRLYIPKILNKSHFIFVSKSMYKDFFKWVKLDEQIIKNNYSIIYNSVGKIFEDKKYDIEKEKTYDYITIRNNFDSSVYCIDIIVKLANLNPNKTFLVIGKGKYFKYNEKPKNLIIKDKYLKHEEMLKYIDKSRCALMPTRRDTQGVMACELATYGIPLITSNLDVCKEVFERFSNVEFIDNNLNGIELDTITQRLINKNIDIYNDCYYQINTCEKEVELINSII